MIIGIGFVNLAKKYNSKLSMVTVLDTSPGYWAHTSLWDNAIVGAMTLVTREFESFESAAKKAKVSFRSEIIESKSITKTKIIWNLNTITT